MAIAAVITADIVNSTMLEKADTRKLTTALSAILKPYKFEFYRGDSFQVYMPDPKNALKVILQTRAAAKRLLPESPEPLADVRASIGIGSVNAPIKSLNTATGEAFLLSGRPFDDMNKSENRLLMQSPNDIVNVGLKITANYIDLLFSQLTTKQAAVIFELLSGYAQIEISKKFKKSQATINKHTQAAKWSEINTLLTDYRLLIDKL